MKILLFVFSFRKRTEEYYHLSHHENPARMRLKLEPSLYHDPHTGAANLRDNTTGAAADTRRLSHEFGSTIASAAINDILTEDEVVLLEEEMRTSIEPQQ